MRRTATFLLAGFALVSFFGVREVRAADAVAVEPPFVTPGKPITLKWYFTGEKVLLSGGRFGKGVVVTGKTSVTDTPHTTTKYTFDVWYKTPAPKVTDPKAIDPKVADPKAIDPKDVAPKATDPKTVDPKAADPKAVDPKAAVPAPPEMILRHVQYTTYAEVWSGVYPPMKAYRDSHGWQVSVFSDWKHDNVPTAAEGSDGLVYFQQEDDSVERLAVAIMPSQTATAEEVLNKISEDVYGHYQNAKLAPPVDLTFNSVPAKMLTFTGMDLSHPGTQTSSLVLVFVRNGRSYVLSARTGAAHFNGRRPILEKILRSFAFNK